MATVYSHVKGGPKLDKMLITIKFAPSQTISHCGRWSSLLSRISVEYAKFSRISIGFCHWFLLLPSGQIASDLSSSFVPDQAWFFLFVFLATATKTKVDENWIQRRMWTILIDANGVGRQICKSHATLAKLIYFCPVGEGGISRHCHYAAADMINGESSRKKMLYLRGRQISVWRIENRNWLIGLKLRECLSLEENRQIVRYFHSKPQ